MNNVVYCEMPKTKSKQPNKRSQWQIVLHDDSQTTFDHVIDVLMDICGHNEIQATQCALITHNNKRCVIYIDTRESCLEVYDYLSKNNLRVTLEQYVKKSH